eukprot:TRINITY_DN74146_c0_g1_i1.p1 TRINITY_DN74146_c0_g1~~TRINITY_DN74146_c0_g1_i1.p1  ORF type:complete len:642 (-),score=155.60 TRINITY_DN74146_c0_g1_i1:81-1925(-)
MAQPDWPLHLVHNKPADLDSDTQLACIYFSPEASPAIPDDMEESLDLVTLSKQRLQEAGFHVLGAWFWPADPGMLTEKEALSPEFRVALARGAVEGRLPYLAVSPWAARHPDLVKNLKAPAKALQEALRVAGHGYVRCFTVAEGRRASQYETLVNDPDFGTVLVSNDDNFLEQPLKFNYLVELPSDADQAGEASEGLNGESSLALSESRAPKKCRPTSDEVFEALRLRDDAFVHSICSEVVAKLLLTPTAQDKEKYATDYALISRLRTTERPPVFETQKLVMGLRGALANQVERPGVLVAHGTLNPVHKGHLGMMRQARKRLEDAGIEVVGAWLCPLGGAAAGRSAAATKAEGPTLSFPFRAKLVELATCDDPLIAVGHFGAEQPGVEDVKKLVGMLQDELRTHFCNSFRALDGFRVFYVCGEDYVELDKGSLWRGLDATRQRGLIVVGREEEVLKCEEPHDLIFIADGEETSKLLTSTQARKHVLEKKVAQAAEALPPAAGRFLLAPTPAEFAQYKADYDSLGVTQDLVAPNGTAELQSQLKKVFEAVGDSGKDGTVPMEALRKLLSTLDPSWSEEELDQLTGMLKPDASGKLDSAAFINTIFAQTGQTCAVK